MSLETPFGFGRGRRRAANRCTKCGTPIAKSRVICSVCAGSSATVSQRICWSVGCENAQAEGTLFCRDHLKVLVQRFRDDEYAPGEGELHAS